jgi:hypothetical protein
MTKRPTTHKSPQGGSVYSEFPIMQFAGLNNRDTSIHIDDLQSSDLMNVHFDNRGAITKRNGYILNASTLPLYTDRIVSLFPYYKSDGNKRLIATSGTKIFDVTGDTSRPITWNDLNNKTWNYISSFYPTWNSLPNITFTIIKDGLAGIGQRFTAATYMDKLYMLNGNITDGLMKWDGTNFSNVVGAPNGKYIVVHKNRLYIAGDPNNPNRLYMSDLGLPENFPALNFIDINTNDGDSITGLAELADSLVIFKERSMHVLRGTGPQNYNLVDTHQTHGTVSHWSVVPIMNKLFFLARDGVYSFDGKHIHLESDLIRGSVLGLNNNQPWNQQFLYNACATDYKNKYWLSVPEGVSQTTNNRVYVFDYLHSAWTRYDIPVSCFCLFQQAASATYNLYTSDPATGNIYQQDVGNTDNGNTINAYYQTKDYDFGSTAHFKSYKGLFFAAMQQIQSYSINVSYIQDLGRSTMTIPLQLGAQNPSQWGTMVWGRDPWGARPDVAKKTTSVAGQSRYLAFKVSDNSSNPWIFLGWYLRYQVKRRLS